MVGKQTRSARMQLVLQLAERAEQKASEQLQQIRRKTDQAQQQWQQVIDYQSEYARQINDKRTAQNALQLMNDRAFLQQLWGIEETQQKHFQQLQLQAKQALSHWQQLHQRRKNIEQMIDRIQQGEAADADKLLQKQIDELSSQAHARRQG